ncbi:hypothetical protein ACHAWO_008539 [Cyclotella atomus]|uniref:Uncharacterized protein n=1 Tax=Cyclotella atomus TaxID=382360 RepID=A0ABD3N2F3_9STRA
MGGMVIRFAHFEKWQASVQKDCLPFLELIVAPFRRFWRRVFGCLSLHRVGAGDINISFAYEFLRRNLAFFTKNGAGPKNEQRSKF